MSAGGERPLGVILAGGKSRRLGRDKAKLTFFGRPLLRGVAEVVSRVTGEVVISGRDPAEFGLPFPWLADEIPDVGPAGGVLTVLAATGRPCLVIPCDLPFLDEATLVRLIEAWRGRSSTALMTTFRIIETGYVESLVAVYDPFGVSLLRRNLRRGERRLSAIFPEELRCHVDYSRTDATLARAFFNINSPPDLALARGMEDRT